MLPQQAVAVSAGAAAAAPKDDHLRGIQGYYRQPTVGKDTIIFVCEDDLWSVPTSGGIARRLTAAKGTCGSPKLSPDGSLVAFVSEEEGHKEVYVMPSIGGEAKRLTFLGSNSCYISGWSTDGKEIYFNASAATPFYADTRAFSITASGGMPKELNVGQAACISINEHGGTLIGRNNLDPARWKRYRGGQAGELWVDPAGDGDFKPLIKLHGNMVCPMWVGDRAYFLSDHEGVGNIYSCAADGSDLKRHTNHTDYYVRFPSTDGKTIVYTAGARIYMYDTTAGAEREVDVQAPSNLTQLERKFIPAHSYLEEFGLHPKGHTLSIIARGQPFTVPLWEGAVVQHGLGSKVRYRLFDWLHDGKRFLVVNDRDGYERVELHYADQSQEPTMVSDGDNGMFYELAVSPVDDIVALTNHRQQLMLLDLKTKNLKVLDHSPAEPISDISWSPDGKWLAYSFAPRGGQSFIKIVEPKTGAIHDVTSPILHDMSPCFDPEGKFLYLLSERDFYPVYDQAQFNMSFPTITRPYLIPLKNTTASPFVPKVRPLVNEPGKGGKEGAEDEGKGSDSSAAATDDTENDSDARDESTKKEAAKKTAKNKQKSNAADSNEKKASKLAHKKKEPPKVEIDFDGIQGRLLAFPITEGLYREIAPVKGRLLYTQFNIKGIRPNHSWFHSDENLGTLKAYDFEDQKETNVQTGVGHIVLGPDHRTLAYRAKERIRVIDALKKGDESGHAPPPNTVEEPGRKTGWLDLNRVKVMVEPADEWWQMLREAWRLQKQHYWDVDMSQVDWSLVLNRYSALLPRVRTRSDLSDLIWEMQGELGTSHAYEMAGDYRPAPNYRRGFLGADLVYDAGTNGYKIVKIYRGDSWEREYDSPLAEPGLGVHEGDVVLAVSGRPVSKDVSVDSLLVDAAGEAVMLTIKPGPESVAELQRQAAAKAAAKAAEKSKIDQTDKEDGANSKVKKGERRTIHGGVSANRGLPSKAVPAKRQVVCKTLRDERDLRYRDWVESNRRMVHEKSNGQVGYIHIPDMGPKGFAEFHRGFLAEYNHPAMIVDVRYNGGGNVSPLLLEKLNRKRVAYDVSRWGLPEPYPHESVAGPMVAITNQFAGSDGDIFSHCFKLYKLGPLIGKRTWGGVIGISAHYSLVDGTVTTQPEYSFWFKDVGWQVENFGTKPDIEVDIAPQDYAAGRDPQIAKALDLLLTSLKEHPVQLPEFGKHPSKALPKELAAPKELADPNG